jgi:hypothetical protein
MAAAPLESSPHILRLSWLTLSYLATSSTPRGMIAGQAAFSVQRRRERSGVEPQRRLGGDRLFDMSASQAFKAGVAFHHVHPALRARWPDFKTGQCMLLVSRELCSFRGQA